MTRFRFPTFEPDRLLALQRELDRAFRAPSGGFGIGAPARGVFPAVNVFDDRDAYVVRMEAPGVAADDFKIESRGRTLAISGKRESKGAAAASASFHRRERESGAFSRSFQLPEDSNPGAAEASFSHGVLTVKVPKREESKPRQITVKAAA